MIEKRQLLVNAIMSVVQIVVISAVLFILYRFLLKTIGVKQLGIWSLVLATTTVSPRELDENELWEKITAMSTNLANPQRAIFNLHCPPYNIGLDVAARLDKTLKPIAGIGGVEMGPVGSHAVLKAIQTYCPMLGLHGHVHESRGAIKIGKTICVNPGSEYTEGILRGCLVLIDKNGVRDYLLTCG